MSSSLGFIISLVQLCAIGRRLVNFSIFCIFIKSKLKENYSERVRFGNDQVRC